MCIVKIILWTCHHKAPEKFEHQNSSPIFLIEDSTIVLTEGRSERGYKPETHSNFLYHSKLVLIR